MWFNDLEKFEKCFSVNRNYKQIDWGMFLSLWDIAHHSVKYVIYIYRMIFIFNNCILQVAKFIDETSLSHKDSYWDVTW